MNKNIRAILEGLGKKKLKDRIDRKVKELLNNYSIELEQKGFDINDYKNEFEAFKDLQIYVALALTNIVQSTIGNSTYGKKTSLFSELERELGLNVNKDKNRMKELYDWIDEMAFLYTDDDMNPNRLEELKGYSEEEMREAVEKAIISYVENPDRVRSFLKVVIDKL